MRAFLFIKLRKFMNQEVSRPTRVALEIRKTLGELLHKETKDPRLQKINITECKISKDLSISTVYFTVIGANKEDEEVADAIQALKKAKAFFRSEIGKRLRLRITPEFRFFYDEVAENASDIEILIAKALHSHNK